MKKFISGLVVGMALMLTGSVFAADIQSMIGKTIQGQFGVTVDGKSLEMPAIVVDGTSFLPVRSFGESVGYAVYFDAEGAVRLEKQVQPLAANETAKQAHWEQDRAASQKRDEEAKAQNDALDAKRKQGTEESKKSEDAANDRLRKAQEAIQQQQQQTQPQSSVTK